MLTPALSAWEQVGSGDGDFVLQGGETAAGEELLRQMAQPVEFAIAAVGGGQRRAQPLLLALGQVASPAEGEDRDAQRGRGEEQGEFPTAGVHGPERGEPDHDGAGGERPGGIEPADPIGRHGGNVGGFYHEDTKDAKKNKGNYPSVGSVMISWKTVSPVCSMRRR